MSTTQNIATFRRVIDEAYNKGNLDVLDDCFAPSYVEHQSDLPGTLGEFKGSIDYMRNTFAPFSLAIDDVIADGDKVWARMTAHGTNSKELMGRPSTGKSFTIAVIGICRFENGKIVEHWGVPDRLHMMVQIGMLEMPQRTPV